MPPPGSFVPRTSVNRTSEGSIQARLTTRSGWTGSARTRVAAICQRPLALVWSGVHCPSPGSAGATAGGTAIGAAAFGLRARRRERPGTGPSTGAVVAADVDGSTSYAGPTSLLAATPGSGGSAVNVDAVDGRWCQSHQDSARSTTLLNPSLRSQSTVRTEVAA